MREPKYRAWHKQQKKMYPVQSLVWFDEKIDPNALQFVYVRHRINEIQTNLLILGPDDVELMQFTGLKDCMGQEICEGDIVRTENAMNERPEGLSDASFEGVVSYYECAFHIVQPEDSYSPTLTNRFIKSIEIIGNIYQNPELMEQSQ